MTTSQEGSIRLFRIGGISVYLHWMWLLVVFYFLDTRAGSYSAPAWAVWECLALFFIVLLHEFGHAIAARQVGGTSDTIVLWPLGGFTYLKMPPRPGAQLWGNSGGLLVNAILIPILAWLKTLAEQEGVPDNLRTLVSAVAWMNSALLVLNILPIYPLDGGQILRSLLWFAVGPIRSLLWATTVGFVGVAALAWFAWQQRSIFTGVIVFMIFMNCRSAWVQARELQAAGTRDA